MNRTTLAVVFLVLLAGCTVNVSIDADLPGSLQVPDTDTTRRATVVYVVDGDTFDVRFGDGTKTRVRLIGVDTPETYIKNTPAEYEGVPETKAGRLCLKKWGERASQFATQRLAGATVTVTVDESYDRRGRYGRLLAYVTLVSNSSDAHSFNYALLKRGYARFYESDFSRRIVFATVEDQAQENGIGLWKCAS